jgi:hypothetical protein
MDGGVATQQSNRCAKSIYLKNLAWSCSSQHGAESLGKRNWDLIEKWKFLTIESVQLV